MELQRARDLITATLKNEGRVLYMATEMRIDIVGGKLSHEIMIHDCECGEGHPVLDSGLQIHHYIFCSGCGKRTAIKDSVVQAAVQWNLMAKL